MIKIIIMSFRARIFAIIFTIGLLPALAILLISAYLLNSALSRVGATGLESSLQAAVSMIDDSQHKVGILLEGKLGSDIPWNDGDRLDGWLRTNRLDLVYRIESEEQIIKAVDSVSLDSSALAARLPKKPGFAPIRFEDTVILLYSVGDSSSLVGCGILMPAGYGMKGRQLGDAISASASLSIYKRFSLKLLAMATGAGMLFVSMAGLILSSVISKRLVRPLKRLTEGARRIGSGDLDHQVSISGDDEFSKLADSFNTMAAEIKENQKRLLETERLAAWREVARRIAHEIRNPLTPITVELYRLQEMLKTDSSDKSIQSLEAIRSQIQVLQELSGQFSTFAKEPELKRVNCSLPEIIASATSMFEYHENVSIHTAFADNIPMLYLDPQMMGRVFGNLIKNSAEASPEGVNIEIAVTQTNRKIYVFVKDDGPGFPHEKLDNIDQPYITTKKGGTGLGLAIVKKIIEEHGGSVEFNNDNGAVAEIMLPID